MSEVSDQVMLTSCALEGKEEYLYSAIYILCISQSAHGMGHTVLPANTPCLPFLRKLSQDGATPN